MKCYWLCFSTVVLSGCLTCNSLEYSAAATTNMYHIARIRKGMDEREVLQIMHKPYSYETYEFDEDVYDVWFYVTKPTVLDQSRMVPQNLTPLTFKNGILVGTGYPWYYYAMNGQAAQQERENPSPEKPKSQEVEDLEFEKTLKDFSQKKQPTTAAKTPLKDYKAPAKVGAATPKAFTKVRLGMNEDEVINLIGPPSSYESFKIKDDAYDALFYEDVPLTFKNGVLVGTTTEYLNKIKQSKDNVRGYTPETERMQEDDSDQKFNYW